MDDPFDDVLNLEEKYYQEGYELGMTEGAEAGRIEGCSVGLKSGFEKFLEAGRLQGRAIVWANRLPNLRQGAEDSSIKTTPQTGEPLHVLKGVHGSSKTTGCLPPLQNTARLEKNVITLYGLVEPGTLSTQNDDDAVNDFDSRIKGAHGKVKVIERAIGEKADEGGIDKTVQPAAGGMQA